MDGMLSPIGGPPAWRGRELEHRGFWPRKFLGLELDALNEALDAATSAPPHLRAEGFAIPALRPLLDTLARELETGAGVIRLSGLPADRYSAAELRTLFWGLCVNLGTPLPQNPQGEFIGEVRDEGGAAMSVENGIPSARARSRSTGPLRFHTDKCDLLALLCASNGISGGVSRVVSTVAIHDEIARRRPDLLAVLYRDFWRKRPADEEARTGDGIFPMPVFPRGPTGAFTSQYSRTYVEMAAAVPGVPPITPEQVEAMDLLAEVADELCIEAPFTPGDIQILNQHTTYHGRTAYADGEAGKRVLMRIWLAPPFSRALPAGHIVQWGSVAPGALRGGARPGQSAFPA